MSIYKPSKEEWQSYFPHPIKDPNRTRFDLTDVNDLLHARFAIASLRVDVDTPWPGLGALDDQYRIGQIKYSIGRWYIDDVAISRIDDNGQEYDIELERITETDWVTHMLGKNWFYDPTDFFDVLEAARQLQAPDESQAWLDGLMWRDVKDMLAAEMLPYFPSRLLAGKRTYLVNRMTTQEQVAFSSFLAHEGYGFEDE